MEEKQEGILFTIDCLKSHKFNFDYCLDELINYVINLQKTNQDYQKLNGELRKEIAQLTNNWNDLEDILKDLIQFCLNNYEKSKSYNWLTSRDAYLCILNKMKEIEENNNER